MAEKRLFSNRQLIQLIIPLVIEQGLTMLVGMCDSVMVSSVGEAAISGVTLVDMINAVILVLFAALATGGAVVTSQFLGAQQMGKARKSASQLVLLSGLIGTGVMVLCLLFAKGLMKLFFGTIEETVMQAGLIYFYITALSFPFIALYNAGAAVFRSMGNSKVSMKVSLLMNFINVTGNAICILGLKMGVEGVAIPTLLSRTVAAAVILFLAAKPNHQVYLQKQEIASMDRKMVNSILRIGIPSACENSLFQLGRLLVGSMIALHGTTQTAAYSVANTLDSLGIMVGQPMGLAMVTVIGQCVGAGDRMQVRHYMKKMMIYAYALGGISNILLLLFLDPMIGLYSSLSTETVTLAQQLVQIHAGFGILLWPAAFVLPNALRAANDVKFTMWVGVGSMFTFRVCTSWVLCAQMGMGALGVWYAMIIDWICRIAFFVTRTVSGKWLKKCRVD